MQFSGCSASAMALGLILLQVPRAAATVWSPVVPIHAGTQQDDYFPIPAITSDGTAWVIWMGIDPVELDQEVYYSRWNGQAWSAPASVNPPNTTADRIPRVACGRDGSLWVLWTTPRADASGNYVGLTSHWTGAAWSAPDTVWSDGDRYHNYDLYAVGSQEAWFIREDFGGDVVVYHHDGVVHDPVQRFDLPNASAYQPTIAVDALGVVWAAWTHQEQFPTPERLEFSRRISGAWDPPRILPVPVETKLPRLTVDRDDVKWIVCAGDDPTNTYKGDDIWAIRWNGSDWDSPTRISDPIQSNDSLQVYNAVSRTPGEYPRAVWLRANLFNYTRDDVLTTAWTGTAWTPVELVGNLADSSYVNWPDVAVRDPSVWVTQMREPTAAPFVWNIGSIHSIPISTLAFSVEFAVSPEQDGVQLSWSLSSIHEVAGLQVYRAQGSRTEAEASGGSLPIFEIPPQSFRGGGITDHAASNVGYYTYWLRVQTSHGEEAWFGPRIALYSPVLRSRLVASVPNPSDTGMTLRGIRGIDRPIEVNIFGVGGRLVRTLRLGIPDQTPEAASEFVVVWDGRGADGTFQPNGIYFARLVTNGSRRSDAGMKLVLLR